MSKRDLKGLGPALYTTRTIETTLKNNLKQLRELLKDNLVFAEELVKALLKEVDNTTIITAIHEEYAGEDISEFCNTLINIVSELEALILGSHELVKKEILKHPFTKDVYTSLIRDDIEKSVQNIFFLDEDEKDSMIAGATQSEVE